MDLIIEAEQEVAQALQDCIAPTGREISRNDRAERVLEARTDSGDVTLGAE